MFDADKIIEGTEDVDEGWWIGAVTVRVCDLFRTSSVVSAGETYKNKRRTTAGVGYDCALTQCTWRGCVAPPLQMGNCTCPNCN